MKKYIKCIKTTHIMHIIGQPPFENNLSVDLTLGKMYEVLEEEEDYRIIDNTGEDYLFPKELFEVLPNIKNETIENDSEIGTKYPTEFIIE